MLQVSLHLTGILSCGTLLTEGSPRGLRPDPTPFRYTFRVEKVEFGNDAVEEDEDLFSFNLEELIENLKLCDTDESVEVPDVPVEGCIFIDPYDNLHLMNVLTMDEVDAAYDAIYDLGISRCELDEEGLQIEESGCVFIDEEGTIHLLASYRKDALEEVKGLRDILGPLDGCEEEEEIPEDGCILFDEMGVHFINVISKENVFDIIDYIEKRGIEECEMDNEIIEIPETGTCMYLDPNTTNIHLVGVLGPLDEVDEYDVPEYAEDLATTSKSNFLKSLKEHQPTNLVEMVKSAVQVKKSSEHQARKAKRGNHKNGHMKHQKDQRRKIQRTH